MMAVELITDRLSIKAWGSQRGVARRDLWFRCEAPTVPPKWRWGARHPILKQAAIRGLHARGVVARAEGRIKNSFFGVCGAKSRAKKRVCKAEGARCGGAQAVQALTDAQAKGHSLGLV